MTGLQRIGRWRILLSSAHVTWATDIARRRHRVDLKDQYGLVSTGAGEHVLGCCGELAVAIVLDLPWPATVDTFRSGFDVGTYQVRARRKVKYELYVRPRELTGLHDHSAHPHILVNRFDPCRPWFWVRGWKLGRDIKTLGRWEDPADRNAPMWLLNHWHLETMDSLPRERLADRQQ